MPDPARVLLVSNDFLPQVGGIQQYSDTIIRRLPDAIAYVARHSDAAAHDQTLPYRVIRGPRRYLLPTPEIERDLRQVVAAEKPDILLFMTPWPLPLLGARIGLPFAVCTHGAEAVMPAKVPGGRMALRAFLRQADLLFAVSRHTGAHLRRTVGPGGPPLRLLRPGVLLDHFRPGLDASAIRERHRLGTDPVVLCVGRLVQRKGQDVLVEAMATIRARVPEARLLLVGQGPIRSSLGRAAARLPADTVVFAGGVPWDELPLYYAAADVFAHPNRSRLLGLEEEGFGVIFLEAQACGRPVIAGRSGGAPEALLEDETGLLVDGGSVAAVSDAVTSLLEDPARAYQMGSAGRAFVEGHFDSDEIVAGLQSTLDAIIRGEPVESEL